MVDEMNLTADQALEAEAAPVSEMSKKERKAAYSEQQKKIAVLRRGVDKQLKAYKKAAVRLDNSYDKNERAQAALALKPNKAKRQIAAMKSQELYDADTLVFKSIHEQILADMAAIELSYDALANYAWKMSLRFKAGESFNKYQDYLAERMAKAQKPIVELLPILFPEPVEEEPIPEPAPESVEEAPAEPSFEEKIAAELAAMKASYEEVLRRLASPAAPAYAAPTIVMPAMAPYGYPAPQAEPEVKVAPIEIDVSAAVAKAVDAVMDKLSAALDEKIGAYAATALPDLASLANFGPTVEAMAQVSEDQEFLLAKVTGVVEKVQAMTDSLLGMNETLAAAAKKQGEISEQQKKTNDIQRYTQREQQGIQATQKVIGKDQIELAEAQVLVNEQQKAATDRQKAIGEAQQALTEQQQALVDTQGAIEEAMKSVMQTQKDIISGQQAIIRGNDANVEASKDLIAMQNEVSALQKDAVSAQKAVVREQKNITERQKATADSQHDIFEELKAIAKESKSLADAVEKLGKKTVKKAAPVVEAPAAEAPAVEAPAAEEIAQNEAPAVQ